MGLFPLPLNMATLNFCFNPKNVAEVLLCQFGLGLQKPSSFAFTTLGTLGPSHCEEAGSGLLEDERPQGGELPAPRP